MCTTFTLTYITCGHFATSHRPCNNPERGAADPRFHTHLERERGGECWDCDPDQTPIFYPADTRKKDKMQDRKDEKGEKTKNDEKEEAKKKKADEAERRL
jgi:hypothetical protein